MDCHLPAPQRTIDFFYAKTFHGLKDVVLHFAQDEYDHGKARENAYASFKNEQCQKCHRGTDHPQIEIFMESKHGDIYTAHGDDYNWKAAPRTWTPGIDYRASTCASCHMSGVGPVLTSHDVTERLALCNGKYDKTGRGLPENPLKTQSDGL